MVRAAAKWIALQLVTAAALAAQSPDGLVLRGRVVDARTASPIRDVGVVVTSGPDTVGRTITDTSGSFQTTGKAGPLIAHFVRLGFHADSIATSVGEFPLRVAMIPASVATIAAATRTPGPVMVRDSAARTGFERRAQRRTGGSFIRANDIAKRKPTRMSDLFRTYPGVRIDDSSGVTQLISVRGTRQTQEGGRAVVIGRDTLRAPTSNVRRCVLRLTMDGHLMSPEFSIDDVRPDEVMGIEVYLGAAAIPVEFSSAQQDSPCGLIMVWTKTGTKP